MALPVIHRNNGRPGSKTTNRSLAPPPGTNTTTTQGHDFDVLKQNEDFIVENVNWTGALEERLAQHGLLGTNKQIISNPVQKLRDVIDVICQGRRQTVLQAFVDALDDTHNSGVSVRLRQQMTLDDASDSDENGTDLSFDAQDTVTMERKLLETRRKMKQWQMRAKNLELEKETLEDDKKELQQWYERTVKTENDATVTIGKLQTQQEMLKHELLKKERGLGLWKKKESEYLGQITQLRERVEEMSGMIHQRKPETKTTTTTTKKTTSPERTKEGKMLKREKSQGNLLSPVLEKTKRNHDRSNTDPTALPALLQGQQGIKTLPHNAKLPSLTSVPRPPPDGASIEDPLPKRTLPANTTRARTLIDVGSVNSNPKLPPLIHSRKLPSPRGSNKSLLSELSSIPTEKPEAPAGNLNSGPNAPLKAIMGEKWIDRQGGEIDIGNIALHIPPNSVSAPVLITVTQTDHVRGRQQQIQQAGLAPYMKPGLQVRLQPHGQKFLRPIYMQMKGAKAAPGKLLVFHKDVDAHKDHDWTDVTEDVKPTVRKEDMVIAISSFSIIETMRLLVPVVSMAAGMAIGYNMSLLRTHALSMLNKKKGPCEFHVFHRDKDPCLQVVCMGQGQTSNNNNNINDKISPLSNLKYLGYQSSRSELCEGERLYFYFDKSADVAASFVFNYEESITKGQRFQIPLSSFRSKTRGATSNSLPELLLVKRRVTEQLDDITLCEAHLHSRKPQPSTTTGLDEPDGASMDYEEPWEEAIRTNRVALVKNIDVRDILDYLIQNNIISADEQEEIKSYRTRKERVASLIDKLTTKGPKGFTVFVQALSEDYEDLSKSLVRGHATVEAT